MLPVIEDRAHNPGAPGSGARAAPGWLPEGRRAAVCFSVDDVHPGTSSDAYEGGGDLDRGCLGRVRRLLERHPRLRVTLFTTADWREIAPAPTRRLLARLPYVRERVYLTEVLPAGSMRLGRHPEFVEYLKQLPRAEVALHGLHHVRRGPDVHAEFRGRDARECARALREAVAVFEEAGLPYVPGMCPPGWELSDELADAMIDVGLRFVASARDIRTEISADAVTNMSGLKGVSLIRPELVRAGRLLHVTSNFQATCPVERAVEIVERGGLLAVKAHAVKNALGHVALDGLDELYCNYLDLLFTKLESDYGDSLWWTSMGEIAERCLSQPATTGAVARAGAAS